VLDTNILLRGLINMQSTAGRVVEACDRRSVLLLLSKPVISEYRAVLMDKTLGNRHPELSRTKSELALSRLRYVAEILHPVNIRFEFPRDPKDAKFIELAIAAEATHLVSGDNDLLSLTGAHGEAAIRFRQRARSIRVVSAAAFLDEMESWGSKSVVVPP
jgi:putative PIN family toxin of toxin-antitoxin system